MAKKLAKTHINKLMDIEGKLAFNLTMTGRQLIVGEENQARIKKARDLISLAVAELNKVV